MTTSQQYSFATPPALGAGEGYSLFKDPKITLSVIDKYQQPVTSRAQYNGANSLYFDVDVRTIGGLIGVGGLNLDTGVVGPTYQFTQEKNAQAFGGIPRREYTLVFKLKEVSPATSSSGQYKIYHNTAEISGVTSIVDGTVVGGNPLATGKIDINLTMANVDYYMVSKFDIYTGLSPSFTPVTGTGAGANLLKTVPVFAQQENYTLTINEGEQPFNGDYYNYKILPYDAFGSGVMTTTPLSGTMYGYQQSVQGIDSLTGNSIVILSNNSYCIQTLHTGAIVGSGYQVIDTVANVSGNILTGNYYNTELSAEEQLSTYPFRTIKYTAQFTDASGYCTSKEILISDNTLSNISGYSGLYISEYAVTDSGNFARILVSGEGTGTSPYSRGTGYIHLMAQLQNYNGSYKLWRTIL